MSYFEGDAALNLSSTVQNIFMDWLRGKLNTTPYSSMVGKSVTVTPYVTIATALYAEQKAFVWVMDTPLPSPEEWRQGTTHKIRHYTVALNLDLASSESEAEKVTPGAEARADRKLVDAITTAVQDGYDELTNLSLYQSTIASDSERQGDGQSRYPHKVTFVATTRVPIT